MRARTGRRIGFRQSSHSVVVENPSGDNVFHFLFIVDGSVNDQNPSNAVDIVDFNWKGQTVVSGLVRGGDRQYTFNGPIVFASYGEGPQAQVLIDGQVASTEQDAIRMTGGCVDGTDCPSGSSCVNGICQSTNGGGGNGGNGGNGGGGGTGGGFTFDSQTALIVAAVLIGWVAFT